MLTHRNRQDKIEALVLHYVAGDISETVFEASLHDIIAKDEIRHLILLNQLAHRNSLPYRRGIVT